LLLLLASCSSEKKEEVKKEEAPAAKEAAKAPSKYPASYKVKFETTKGPVVIEVTRDWSPLGADRFYELVQDKFFDDAGFFRVVPNFIIQFGLAADPAKTAKWNNAIADDPVIRTNKRGTITFATAGPRTRTTQLFINLRSNQMLDDQGFSPFGQVIEGMEVVDKLFAGHGEKPDQGLLTSRGNAYLKPAFPGLDYIKKATIQ
jgi:peptidyl-prolyl cis-trans isomerase A (cyclophilin A)